MSDILKLYHYHRWANEQVIQHLKTLPAVSLQQKLKSVFPTVNAVLVHIYRADYIWLHVLYGETFEQIVSQFDQFEKLDGDFEAIEHRMTELDKEFSEFLKEMENPEGPISISHPRLGTLQTTYADVIRHVVNHGTYHRGNIIAMLHQMGYKGVPTDYIFFSYES
ncbi:MULTISPECIES: DinB family protein [Bacillus]|uniref:DinB family protein n=1 Tax=Bacillus TaxID=1386 RepID=UPI000B8C3722|nr:MULTISPECIES: DinB family protein [Bacillus]ASP25696.1 damage-inducible protein DinB [Bacillus velezensis]ATO10457.1 damage-inducible protein DinB [Bacillus velezensis]AZI46416.1 damage-inducible protein DinB [Bacillus velezensis]MBE7957857.1 damage-inducible protein DinB [Bacillus amyloliquefaciens]MBG9463405.1 damage-inducible protein DinB [Bacillus amyloliquefaciens]